MWNRREKTPLLETNSDVALRFSPCLRVSMEETWMAKQCREIKRRSDANEFFRDSIVDDLKIMKYENKMRHGLPLYSSW